MTSKEALDIIKQRINTIRLNTKIGSRRIADEENAVLLDNIEHNLNKLCELVERDTPMKVIKTPHQRLLELGWIIDKDDTNPANLEFYYNNNKVLIIDKALKVIKTLYDIDLQLAEILVDYLKELRK